MTRTKSDSSPPITFDDLLLQEFKSSERGKGFIKMLKRINRAGEKGIPTRKACDIIFNSRTYGLRMIELAAKLGYIKREKRLREPDRVGRPAIVNIITPEGRQLLQDLGVSSSSHNHNHNHNSNSNSNSNSSQAGGGGGSSQP